MVAKTTVGKLLKRLREDLQDLFEPYLWGDAELIRYINEGQIEFCRRGCPIFDSTSLATQLQVTSGSPEVTFAEEILDVLDVFQKETVGSVVRVRPLRIGTQTNFMGMHTHLKDDYGNVARSSTLMHESGETCDVFLDYDSEKLYLAQIPDRDFELLLRVTRIPLEELDDCNNPIELKRIYHPAILCWAAYLAFMRQDSETYDEKAAQRFRAQFDDHAALAQEEKTRRYSTPGTVAYGGI
jgi:hypothetical protein